MNTMNDSTPTAKLRIIELDDSKLRPPLRAVFPENSERAREKWDETPLHLQARGWTEGDGPGRNGWPVAVVDREALTYWRAFFRAQVAFAEFFDPIADVKTTNCRIPSDHPLDFHPSQKPGQPAPFSGLEGESFDADYQKTIQYLVQWEGPDAAPIEFDGFAVRVRAPKSPKAVADLLGDFVPKTLSAEILRRRMNPAKPPVDDLDSILATPAARWIDPGFLAEGEFTVTYAGVKKGKTAFALRRAARLVATSAAMVTYCALEDYRNVKRRAYWAMRAEGMTDSQARDALLSTFVVADCSGVRLLDESKRVALESAIADGRERAEIMERPHLTVVDNISAGIGEGNQTQDTSPAASVLDTIRQRHKCAMLAIHHANSEGDFAGFKMPERLLFCLTRLSGDPAKRGVHGRLLLRTGGENVARLGTYRLVTDPGDPQLPLAVLDAVPVVDDASTTREREGPVNDELRNDELRNDTQEGDGAEPALSQEGRAEDTRQPVASESAEGGYRAAEAVALPVAVAALQFDPSADIAPVIDGALGAAGLLPANPATRRSHRKRIADKARNAVAVGVASTLQ